MNPRLPDPLAPQQLSHAVALAADFYLGEAMVRRDREAVLIRPDGALDEAAFRAQLKLRNDRKMELLE